MSVASPTSRIAYTITSLPQTLTVSFDFNQTTELQVLDGGATNSSNNPANVLTLGSDYTVSGGGYNAMNQLQPGSIVVVADGAGNVQVGDVITILRKISPIQTTTFASTGLQTPLMIEADDDKLTTIDQQLQDAITRAIRAPAQEAVDWVLPNAAARVSSFVFFDSNGALIVYSLASVIAAVSAGTTPAGQNKFFAGPVSGGAGTPVFRAIASSDLTGLTGFASSGAIGSSNLTQITARLLGRTTGGTGAIEQISVGSNLALAAGSLDTIQGIKTTDSPTFARVTGSRADGDYSVLVVGPSLSAGFAASGTNFLFDSLTLGETIWSVDAIGNFYFPRLTTNGFVRTSGGAGVLSVDAFGQQTATTTNDSAAAGKVGEYVTATLVTGSAISLSSNIASNITSIALTAGDWDVSGVVYVAYGTTTTSTGISAWISTSSATYPGFLGATNAYNLAVAAAAGQALGLTIPTTRISINAGATAYLSIAATFATSTLTAAGTIRARRVR